MFNSIILNKLIPYPNYHYYYYYYYYYSCLEEPIIIKSKV